MAEWDDAPLVGPEPVLKAPSEPTTGSSPWDAAPVSGARAKASVFSNSSPDEAGKALSISKKTGIPASIVKTDLPGYDAHAKTQAAIEAVKNPAIAKYIDENRMAPQVSNDDYGHMDEVSQYFENLKQDQIHAQATGGIIRGIPEIAALTQTAPGREKLLNALTQLPGELGKGILDFFQTPGKVASGEVNLTTPEGLDKGIGFGLGVALGGRDIRVGRAADLGPVAPASGNVDDFLAKVRGAQTRQEINDFIKSKATAEAPKQLEGPKDLSAGATPVDELWQMKLNEARANTAGEALDSAIEASQESTTKERSPELYEKFIEAHGDTGTVHVPAQAILDLYQREGKVPMAGDGLFGFVPGIADKATLAAETGAEVAIPMPKYIAHVDPTVHEGLKDVVRVHPDGVTREEAKVAKEEQAAKIEAYHGTPHDFESFDLSKIGTGEGAQVYGHGLYFAENRAVGAEYQKQLAQMSPLAQGFLKRAGYDTVKALFDFDHSNHNENAVARQEIASGESATKGQLYKVHINADPTHFLDWDKPLSEQASSVQEAAKKLQAEHDLPFNPKFNMDSVTGKQLHNHLQDILDVTPVAQTADGLTRFNGREAVSKALAEAGIPGIKYLDQGSRPGPGAMNSAGMKLDKPAPTRNFVVFDDKLVKIIEKNDNPIVQAVVEVVAKEKKSLYLEQFFKDGESIGITQPEFKRYSDMFDRGQEMVLEKAIGLAKREAAKRLTPEWKSNEARVRQSVDGLLYNRPDFAADRFFNQGLMQDGKKVSPELRVKMGEVSADEYAPLFGFESGSEMSSAVLRLEQERADTGKGPKWQFEKHVNEETAKQMEAQYGKLADNIAIEASEAALAEHNVDVLSTELKMLAKLNNWTDPLSREEITKWFTAQFDKSIASEADYETWRRASEKGGRDAKKAWSEGDVEEALLAKQRQIKAFILAKATKNFEKETMSKVNATLVRLQDNRVLSTVEQEYTDQLHRLIDQLGFKNPRAPNELASALGGKSLNDFIREKEGAGADMPVADFLKTGKPIDFDKLTVNDMRALNDSLDTILHNGREAKTIRVGEEKRDRLQTIAEAVNQVADVDPKIISRDGGILADMRKNATAFDSMMLKMEQVLRWMDKRDKFGVYSQAVFRGISDAKHHENDLLVEMGKAIKAIKEDKEWRKNLTTQIPNTYPSILDWQTGEPMVIQRKDMLMMMAHSGNDSNHGKMTSSYEYNGKTYQWNAGDVAKLIEDHATAQDWNHVQAWWDIFEKYWPQVEGLARRMSGIAPDKIEARSFTNDHGTFKGGYVPVGADLLWPGIPKVEQGVFNSDRYFNAIPPKGYLQTRTNAGYPVSLAFDNLTNTMRQMAHDLAYREPLTNAAKFLDNNEVRGAIQRALGPEYLRQVRPWLEYQATAKAISDESVGALSSIARSARQRIVAVQLLYRASTMFKHGAAAALYSAGEVGGRAVTTEAMRLWGTADGRARVQEIMAESGELRHRLHNMDRDLGENMDRNMGDSGARATVEHWGGMGTSVLDLGTAVPTYEVAKKNALLEGKSESDAIYAGESAVRDAHGSSGTPDLSPVMRAGEMYKLFTIAYGTFNHNYNRLRDAGRLYKEAGQDFAAGERLQAWDKFQAATWRSLWYIFLVAAAEEAIQPVPEKDGEHSGAGMWAMKAIFHQLSGTIPILREAARSYLYRGKLEGTGQTPMGQVMESTFKGGKSLWEHDFDKRSAVKNAIEGTGYVLKLPGFGQLSQTLQYMQDLKTGRQTGENPYRFGRGILMGKSHPERK